MLLLLKLHPCTVNTTSQNLRETEVIEQPILGLGEQDHLHQLSHEREEVNFNNHIPSNNLETYFSESTDNHYYELGEQSGQATMTWSGN